MSRACNLCGVKGYQRSVEGGICSICNPMAGGVSLLDRFAAVALPPAIRGAEALVESGAVDEVAPSDVAKVAYGLAEAMLVERHYRRRDAEQGVRS